MTLSFKPLSDQVIVLTGATSGIGLATARLLSREGARLVLVARGEDALETLAEELGAECTLAVPTDVAEAGSVERVAERAVARFGHVDTWINDAGVAIYGKVEDVPLEDHRRLFETNYWGVVHGTLTALRLFRRQGGTGKIVNMGSQLSDRAMILQGPYSASKFAVKAITDAVRTETAEAGLDVSITLVKPGAIDTPYMEHARNHMDTDSTVNPPPSYDPALVAKAIAHACTHDARDLDVGGAGWATAKMTRIAPRTTDAMMQATGRMLQRGDTPPRPGMRDNLHSSARNLEERSGVTSPARRTSLMLEAQMHPVATAAVGLALAAGAAALARRARNSAGR
ncbi:SDR family oxidoreductase [Jannaschia formosa]|uniref:SDR family oxidoreductase n=1 Tax=Jannaschia formosa TaxID=2259592 RepID=UPI000E1B600C|nr:SDR family oxidoreductase [Jannaschia formosa]TFL19937.1 SDR family NAD(P)-dependent oxidoreductase [Jannaschia formosa]